MVRFAPTQTGAWDAYEASAVRQFSRSLVSMAAVTGFLWRLSRAMLLGGAGSAESPLIFGSVIALGVLVFFGMATLHVGNYPLKRWLWRVPAFAAVEALAEVAMAALLIALGREPNGSAMAEWADLPSIGVKVLTTHVLALSAYAAVLALVVQGIRRSVAVVGDVVIDDPKDDQ
jgi:hypothetical protein